MAMTVVCLVIYAMIFALTYYSSIKETPGSKLKKAKSKSYISFYITLFVIFIVQLVSTQYSKGYIQDTGLFRRWTSFGNDYHIWEYYTTKHYVDYPPVYLCVLFVVGKIAALFGVSVDSNLYLCFIRFVPILFDMLCSVFIFRFAKDRLGDKTAMTLALLSAINPINIFNSTVWGQIDSVVSLMIIGVLWFLYSKKYVASTALFVLSFLTKPQMIIYAPVFGFTILFDFIDVVKDKEERTKMLKSLGLSLVAGIAVLLIAPLAVTGGNYMLLVDKFKSALGMYEYATVCAANFYGAIGANWVKNYEPFLFFDYKTWGFIFIVVMSLMVGFVTYKSKDRTKIFYMGAFTVSTIYMFAHGMHERYIYPLFLMLMVIYILKKDAKVLCVYLLFSLSNLVNCVQTLITNHKETFFFKDPLFICNSWVNLFIYAFMVYIFYVALFKKKENIPVPLKVQKKKPIFEKLIKESKENFQFQKPYEKTPIVKKDYLIMAIITIVYSVVAFWNLGSMNEPETGWYPQKADESVVIDLGKVCDIERIYTRSGWIDRHVESRSIERDLRLEISDDGKTFKNADASIDLNKVFVWKVTETPISARYIKITPDDDRFYLNEIAFFGENESQRYIPKAVISDNETAQLLIDEQDKVKYEFSWYENAYFDEIYHPRTAYEYTQDLYPYENTHPPLGKVIISWGIMLFGMNPFGWRFTGTLCGVLMVPLVYVFAKKVFKKTEWATLACTIFTFDFMHLSQTRLATIDSYTAFFVMGMYFFMYLYIKRSFYNEGFKKTVPPLLASGIFFGLGAAAKWQGIYAGAGLCVLFFVTLFKRYREYKEAQKRLSSKSYKCSEEERAHLQMIEKTFKPCAIKTIVCGALFFVVIPFIIYFMSYIPTMNNEGVGIGYFFKNQGIMFGYHSSIEGKHPYMSDWWSWPLDMRPLYAYSPNRMFVPEGTAMGISTFGNPAVWWLTIPVIIAAIYMFVKRKGSEELKMMLAGFLAMYLPWVLIARSSFIYHFFPCVIFVVFMIVYFMKYWYEKAPSVKRGVAIMSYAGVVVVLFALFYPVLTGIAIPETYAQMLEWLPSWVLG